MLAVKQLKLQHGARTLARGLTFEVKAGERWALLGPNGCGKSTLLATLAGVRPSLPECIVVQGKPLSHWTWRELACLRSLSLQTEHDVFSLPAIQRVLAVRQPWAAGLGWESEQDWQSALHWLNVFDLASQAQQDILTLSGGERQRLALAAAFAQGSPLMLFDEPTAHLDPPHASAFFQELQRHTEVAAVIALHDMHQALRHCSHALLFQGEQVLCGSVQKILTQESLEKAFSHPFIELGHDGKRVFLPQ
jgi:iron complex transport system ATP-binding protein